VSQILVLILRHILVELLLIILFSLNVIGEQVKGERHYLGGTIQSVAIYSRTTLIRVAGDGRVPAT